MQGFALTPEQIIEILSVYATADQQILAVATTPGWYVIGAFTMPATAEVVVDILGSVSDAALSLRVRLYCLTAGHIGPVSGSTAQLSNVVDSPAKSGLITIEGGRQYQFQAEVTGGVRDDKFAVVRRATLTGNA